MSKQAEAIHQVTQRQARVTGIIGFGLPITAVVTACWLCSSEMPISITNPAVLVLASLFVLAPFKSLTSTKVLQKIIAFYLVSVVVSELSSQYFKIPFLPFDMSTSCSTIVLSLLAAGYFFGRANLHQRAESIAGTGILHGWVLALVVIVVHMVLLGLMLRRFYGYGYERDLAVLGNLCLYFLLFVFLWNRLGACRFRQAVGLILMLFYSCVILKKVGL